MHACMQVAATFAADKPLGYEMNKEFSWTQTVRIASPEGEATRHSHCWVGNPPGGLPVAFTGRDAWWRKAYVPQAAC